MEVPDDSTSGSHECRRHSYQAGFTLSNKQLSVPNIQESPSVPPYVGWILPPNDDVAARYGGSQSKPSKIHSDQIHSILSNLPFQSLWSRSVSRIIAGCSKCARGCSTRPPRHPSRRPLPSPAAVVADIALATPRGARRRVAGTAVRTAHPPLQAAAARAIDARASRAARGAVAAAASLPRRRRCRRWTARMPGPVPVRVDILYYYYVWSGSCMCMLKLKITLNQRIPSVTRL